MAILIKDGHTIKRYKASGEIGEGQGAKAGMAYRLKDGPMVYAPEADDQRERQGAWRSNIWF